MDSGDTASRASAWMSHLKSEYAIRVATPGLLPARDQQWWVTADETARSIHADSAFVFEPALWQLSSGDDLTSDLRLWGAYVLWRLAALGEEERKQAVFLDWMRGLKSDSGFDLDQSRALLGGLSAIYEVEYGFVSTRRDLLSRYSLADEAFEAFPVLAFRRLRRAIGIELLETLDGAAEASDSEMALVLDQVLEDCESEEHVGSSASRQLAAEARYYHARVLMLPRVRDYAGAVEQLRLALRVDTAWPGEDRSAFLSRRLRYESLLRLAAEGLAIQMGQERDRQELKSALAEAEARIEASLAQEAARLRVEQEQSRRDSFQLLGLLAAVVALITTFAASSVTGPLAQQILLLLATTGAVITIFSFFSLMIGRVESRRLGIAVASIAGGSLVVIASAAYLLSGGVG